MKIDPNAKIGFWTGVGFLCALLVWNIASNRIAILQKYSG